MLNAETGGVDHGDRIESVAGTGGLAADRCEVDINILAGSQVMVSTAGERDGGAVGGHRITAGVFHRHGRLIRAGGGIGHGEREGAGIYISDRIELVG